MPTSTAHATPAVRARTTPPPSRRDRGRARLVGVLAIVCILLAGAFAAVLLALDTTRGLGAASGAGSSILPPASVGHGPFGVEDGYIEEGDGVSPFADELPALANLDPDLRAAMQAAADAATADGVEFIVTNGWRSADYQRALFDAAVTEYGSTEAASAYVASPERSKHVTGEAVDIGRTDANSWLSQHGSDYGLCQTYANEMWHFELSTTPGGECPAMLRDASEG
ncbi:M15 family metallopeptidase [Plantibacter flavus]|uniref:M15 family metallopeptidase n=1 Tax=Plantibacter flavus TaxID=150123 RepID=UPI003F14B9D0